MVESPRPGIQGQQPIEERRTGLPQYLKILEFLNEKEPKRHFMLKPTRGSRTGVPGQHPDQTVRAFFNVSSKLKVRDKLFVRMQRTVC